MSHAADYVNSPKYREGIELFNSGHYYDCHEVLEDVWREAPVQEKKFLQGLIQVAVGLHHYSTGNLAGARSLTARGHGNLCRYGERHGGVELSTFRDQVAKWMAAIECRPTTLLKPRIEWRQP
jgi:predicted metal-dependent hydrolase